MINAKGLATPYQSLLDSSLDTKFLNGTYRLEEGRHIKPDDRYAALISKELAERNNLAVGDKITFQNSIDEEGTSTFTILGIFSGTEGMTHSAITPDGLVCLAVFAASCTVICLKPRDILTKMD